MKRIFRTILTLAVLAVPFVASAQSNADPEGYVTYSLPMTTITLDVEAVQETFYAGPYAKYAEKYLGIPDKDDSVCGGGSELRVFGACEKGHSQSFGLQPFCSRIGDIRRCEVRG